MAKDDPADILEEHRQITRMLGHLDEAIDTTRTDAEWAARVRHVLGDLIPLLKAHFRGEAEASFFREVMEGAPHLAPLLNRLALEHPKILAGFEAAEQLAGAVDPADVGRVSALKRSVVLAMATLKRHEAEENELIMQAHWDVLGGPG